MIDDSDGDFALLAIGGPIGLILAIILWVVASQNKAECSEMQCPHGGIAKLLDHECVCTETPLPKGSVSAHDRSPKT